LIAKMAKERDTGARGLRSIVEEVMTDIMFDLPDLEPKEKFTITDRVVRREETMHQANKGADKKSA
jgi:ATP-dependent Clp protease ATP-binding subunit ClpX